jgi:hypothetical protein
MPFCRGVDSKMQNQAATHFIGHPTRGCLKSSSRQRVKHTPRTMKAIMASAQTNDQTVVKLGEQLRGGGIHVNDPSSFGQKKNCFRAGLVFVHSI